MKGLFHFPAVLPLPHPSWLVILYFIPATAILAGALARLWRYRDLTGSLRVKMLMGTGWMIALALVMGGLVGEFVQW